MNDEFIKRDHCPVCDSVKLDKILSRPFTDEKIRNFIDSYYEGRIPYSKLENTDYTLLECSFCELIFQEFILSSQNMENLYETWISADESLAKKQNVSINVINDLRCIINVISNLLNKKPEEISVLEYGMGWGVWLYEAKKIGYEVTGVELSERRLAHAKEIGIKVISDITQEKEGAHNYIYINQVFEHLSAPTATLQELIRLLHPGGVIHMSVPQGRSIRSKLNNRNWRASKDCVQPLEHINCFNRKTLIKMGEVVGLKVITSPFINFGLTPKGIAKSLARYIYTNTISTQIYFMKK